MAEKRDIVNDIKKSFDGASAGNLKQVADYFGHKSTKTTRRFLDGVPHYETGKHKMYLAIDIAARIVKQERI